VQEHKLTLVNETQARKHAETRLRQSDEIFRLLVESVKDYAIFLLDPNGVVATWNAGAERIKGYTADEIIGLHFSIFRRKHAKVDGRSVSSKLPRKKDDSWMRASVLGQRGNHGAS
jgi:PAS domain S-box-containing protein